MGRNLLILIVKYVETWLPIYPHSDNNHVETNSAHSLWINSRESSDAIQYYITSGGHSSLLWNKVQLTVTQYSSHFAVTVEATTLFVTLLIILPTVCGVVAWLSLFKKWHFASCGVVQYCNILWRSTHTIISQNVTHLHTCCEKSCHRPLHSQSHPECAHCESHRAQLRNRDLIFTKGLTT